MKARANVQDACEAEPRTGLGTGRIWEHVLPLSLFPCGRFHHLLGCFFIHNKGNGATGFLFFIFLFVFRFFFVGAYVFWWGISTFIFIRLDIMAA